MPASTTSATRTTIGTRYRGCDRVEDRRREASGLWLAALAGQAGSVGRPVVPGLTSLESQLSVASGTVGGIRWSFFAAVRTIHAEPF